MKKFNRCYPCISPPNKVLKQLWRCDIVSQTKVDCEITNSEFTIPALHVSEDMLEIVCSFLAA